MASLSLAPVSELRTEARSEEEPTSPLECIDLGDPAFSKPRQTVVSGPRFVQEERAFINVRSEFLVHRSIFGNQTIWNTISSGIIKLNISNSISS